MSSFDHLEAEVQDHDFPSADQEIAYSTAVSLRRIADALSPPPGSSLGEVTIYDMAKALFEQVWKG